MTNKNGKTDKPGGWYYLTDEERDFVVATMEARFPRKSLESTLMLYDTLNNKKLAPEPIFASSDEASVPDSETRSKM